MAGRGPAPKVDRVNKADKPGRGEINVADGVGWQHGDMPAPPDGLMEASVEAWATWMGSWVAWFWRPEDVPGLRQVIRLYDQVERGEFQRAAELRLQMDTYGITPKGQQDRRWRPPTEDRVTSGGTSQRRQSRYAHLQVVDDCPGDPTPTETTGSTSPASDTNSSNGGRTTSRRRATPAKSSSSRRNKPGS